MEFGLALAGGGTRGAAHVGVLLALEEANMKPRSIAGTSAGSMVAGLYASGMTVKELVEVVHNLKENGRSYIDVDYLGIIKFIPQLILGRKISLSGLIKGEKILKYICELTKGKNINDAMLKIVIPTVDLNCGDTIAYTNSIVTKKMEGVNWRRDIKICDAIMASSAVPAIIRPRNIDGYCLTDGGVTNVMPVDLLIGAGEPNVIAIDIGENYKSLKEENIIEITIHSYSMMREALKECTSTGEKILIKPELPKGAGLITFEYMEECMTAGYEITKKMLPEIKKSLNK